MKSYKAGEDVSHLSSDLKKHLVGNNSVVADKEADKATSKKEADKATEE